MYDIANRLSSAGGVSYAWSNNGNLLSDGVATYTYNHTNRLASVTQGPSTYTFAYNGLGDRLRQTVNGTPTSYTLDLARSLTQVLSDGMNAYLYGNDRLGEEQPGGWQYYLGDALGSVRQLADASVNVTLTRSYEPFGDPLQTTGTGTSIFAFTGEQRDGTGLVYLRARYYGSSFGRFLSRDVWEGNPFEPVSHNPWLYVANNPVNLLDPSGYWHCTGHPECERWFGHALGRLRAVVPGIPGIHDLMTRFDALDRAFTRRQEAALMYPGYLGPLWLREHLCRGQGFPFVVTQRPPGWPVFRFRAQAMPWAIYVWQQLLETMPPSPGEIGVLGHELYHRVLQPSRLALTVQGELQAAQYEARIDRALGAATLPDWLRIGEVGTVENLSLYSAEDLLLWEPRGYEILPLAPDLCSLTWPEGEEPLSCRRPSGTPAPPPGPTPAPSPPRRTEP
jgi:RHS repeat-associated protein